MDPGFVDRALEAARLCPSVDEETFAVASSVTSTVALQQMISDPDCPAMERLHGVIHREAPWRWRYDRAGATGANEIQESDVQVAGRYLKTAQALFDEGAKTASIEHMWVAATMIHDAGLNLAVCLDADTLSAADRSRLARIVKALLVHTTIDFALVESASFGSRRIYNAYLEVIPAHNIPAVFQFIDQAIERSGGISPPGLSDAVRLLCFLDPARLAEILAGVVDPLLFSCLSRALPLPGAIQVAALFRGRGTLQLIGIMRAVLLAADASVHEPAALPAVVALLQRLYERDAGLTAYLLDRFSNSTVFYRAFGRFLATGADYTDRFLEATAFDLHGTFRVRA